MKSFKAAILVLSVAFCFTFAVTGCSSQDLTDVQKARVAELEKANKELADKLGDVLAKAKVGTATLGEIADVTKLVTEQTKRNVEEIKSIKAEGGSTAAAIWGAIGGTLGRSAIHALKIAVPAGLPGGGLLSGVLSLILGGSGTSKPKDPTQPST